MLRPAVAALLLAALPSCGGGAAPAPGPAGGTAQRLDDAFGRAAPIPHITSLAVSRGSRLEREAYWNGGGPDTPQDVRSVTKSVVALLVGIALERGCLGSVDETLAQRLEPFVGHLEPAKGRITLRHLLTMSSGFEWHELGSVSEYNGWVTAPNQVDYLLARPLVTEPGTRFEYNSAALHLLSVILRHACGASTSLLAQRDLFGPLGIGERPWERDEQGYDNGAAGLSITPRDMQAIGDLVLNQGRSGDRQVVEASWIQAATRVQIATNNAIAYGPGYGYGWWVGQSAGSDVAFAMGYGGQFIVIAPSTRVVVTATAQWRGIGSAAADDQWSRIIDLVMNQVLPAFGPG